jgi:hypothetical protein
MSFNVSTVFNYIARDVETLAKSALISLLLRTMNATVA